MLTAVLTLNLLLLTLFRPGQLHVLRLDMIQVSNPDPWVSAWLDYAWVGFIISS